MPKFRDTTIRIALIIDSMAFGEAEFLENRFRTCFKAERDKELLKKAMMCFLKVIVVYLTYRWGIEVLMLSKKSSPFGFS